MSDENLDDFFAKKDKSKKKKKTTKSKSSSLEGKSKKDVSEKKKAKDAEKSEPKFFTADRVIKDDDQWNDFKSDEVDISGLRIQNLQTAKEDEDECEENGENEAAAGSDQKSEQSVWKTTQTTTSNKGSDDDDILPIPEPAPKVAAVPAHKEPPSEPKKYIPPGMRQAMNQPKTTITSVNMANKRKGGKTAPNLQSEFDFPTLEGATHPELEKQERDKHAYEYEVVRGSAGARQVETHKPAHIQLGNQFDVLGR